MEQLRLTEHARRRLSERGITETDVLEVLDHPETSHPSATRPDTTMVRGRTPSGRLLSVVVQTDHPKVIVSAWFPERPR